jgi:hypothetical protein
MTKLRIKGYCRKAEFDIHGAMMDEGLGNYGDAILELLKEGYGFEHGNIATGRKWYVSKNVSGLSQAEQHKMLEEALIIIFKLLNCFRKKITE